MFNRNLPITETTKQIQALSVTANPPRTLSNGWRMPTVRAAQVVVLAVLVTTGLQFGNSLAQAVRFVLVPVAAILCAASLGGLARLLGTLVLARTRIGSRLSRCQALRFEERLRWERARASRAARGNIWTPWSVATRWVAVASRDRLRQQASRRAAYARGAADIRQSVQKLRFDGFCDGSSGG